MLSGKDTALPPLSHDTMCLAVLQPSPLANCCVCLGLPLSYTGDATLPATAPCRVWQGRLGAEGEDHSAGTLQV